MLWIHRGRSGLELPTANQASEVQHSARALEQMADQMDDLYPRQSARAERDPTD